MTASGGESILARLNSPQVSTAARHESRNREKHLPPLSTFRWWARRTGAVNEAVIEAAEQHFDKRQLNVADPFAGGGTIPLIAMKAGHRVHAQDLNPWAAAGIQQMLTLPQSDLLWAAHQQMEDLASALLQSAYATRMADGEDAMVLHTYRVAVGNCTHCGGSQRQFPYSLLTLKFRKERNRAEGFLACRVGHVFEGSTASFTACPHCDVKVDPHEIYTPRRQVECNKCGAIESLSTRAANGWYWEPVLIERGCKTRREFDFPTKKEITQAERGWEPARELPMIPAGSETNVLLRHGFKYWSDLLPQRQQVVTQSLLDLTAEIKSEEAVTAALRTAIVGTVEFAGYLSRWDRFYLKCNDATAGHRFNFSTFVPELNVWGAGLLGRGTVTRRVKSMAIASDWLQREIYKQDASGGRPVPSFSVHCGDSAKLHGAADHSYDLVLTDPPYHDDVHYGELSLLFRAWSGLAMEDLEGEASTNRTKGVNSTTAEYSTSLVRVFKECRRVLRPEGRLIFSYANRNLAAWQALFNALEESGFVAVGCVSVHSENETDFKKRDVRSCVEDLLMEFSPYPCRNPARVFGSVAADEGMQEITSRFVQVGHAGA